jgi:hypothetical protein
LFTSNINFIVGKPIFYKWSYGSAYKPDGIKQTLLLYKKNKDENIWEHVHTYKTHVLPSIGKYTAYKLFRAMAKMQGKEFLLVLTTTMNNYSTHVMAKFIIGIPPQ